MPTHHDAPAGLTIAANGLVLAPAETVKRPGGEPVTTWFDVHVDVPATADRWRTRSSSWRV